MSICDKILIAASKLLYNGENWRLKSCAWISGLFGTNTVGRYDLNYKESLTCTAPCIIFWIFNTLRQIQNQILYDICMCSKTDIGLYIDNVITHAGQYGQHWYYMYGRTIHMLCSCVAIFISFIFVLLFLFSFIWFVNLLIEYPLLI